MLPDSISRAIWSAWKTAMAHVFPTKMLVLCVHCSDVHLVSWCEQGKLIYMSTKARDDLKLGA